MATTPVLQSLFAGTRVRSMRSSGFHPSLPMARNLAALRRVSPPERVPQLSPAGFVPLDRVTLSDGPALANPTIISERWRLDWPSYRRRWLAHEFQFRRDGEYPKPLSQVVESLTHAHSRSSRAVPTDDHLGAQGSQMLHGPFRCIPVWREIARRTVHLEILNGDFIDRL